MSVNALLPANEFAAGEPSAGSPLTRTQRFCCSVVRVGGLPAQGSPAANSFAGTFARGLVLIFFGVTLVATAGVLLYLFSLLLGPDKYDVYVGREAVSPDKTRVATFYTISGGGAAGYVLTRLQIRPQSQKFSADKNTNDFVFELRHGSDLDLQWQGNKRLKVVYESGADTYLQVNESDGVKISYQAKTVNALPQVEK